jgi:DNA helicase-2/ATP-dependent DNA helicase PcrA
MRRIVNTPSAAGNAAPLGPCAYEVGNRVEHPKFGVGMVARIEQMAEDYKLVVDFGQYGEKTLLAKFAKLTKL